MSSSPRPPAFKYVPQKYVDDYHRLGWALDRDGQALYIRGGEPVYLMKWICECNLVVPYAHHPDRFTRSTEHARLRNGETMGIQRP